MDTIHLRLTGKHVVDFLVVLIELLSLAVNGLGAERISSRSSHTVFFARIKRQLDVMMAMCTLAH